MNNSSKTAPQTSSDTGAGYALPQLIERANALCGQIPNSLIALLARFSIAGVFWKSGQTKIEGLAIDIINGEFSLGMPSLSGSAVYLFQEEYRLPLISPELAAPMAAFAEHLFPILLLFGLATRFSALALLVMTLVIQIFVYPSAWPTHGVWAATLLYLMAQGPGRVSLDHWIAARYRR
ncbi:DoxX family protein [Nitrincola sp. MINF-07-Sa-05]|uniref:DoxX family protein n=1 Tax=Nitrincola salilacus TaxID=3400273 RepID=UPI003917C873